MLSPSTYLLPSTLQVARIDALTPEEELALIDIDRLTLEAEECVLQRGDRVLHDRGEEEGGYCAGRVAQIDERGRVHVQLDGEGQCHVMERTNRLFKAPPPTSLSVKDIVRHASDDHALPGTMRWEYGAVVRVHAGGELVDIDLQNGEQFRSVPTYDIELPC